MVWHLAPPPLSSRLESSSHNLQFTILFFMWWHQMTFITPIQLSNKHIQLMTRDAISFQWPSFLWCTTIVMWAVGHHWGGLVIHHLKKTMSFCYIVNWRISKLFLPDNLYSGAKHIFLSSQSLLAFIVLLAPFSFRPDKYNILNLCFKIPPKNPSTETPLFVSSPRLVFPVYKLPRKV